MIWTPEKLNKLLKSHDLGDDLFEDENRIFDAELFSIPRPLFEKTLAYANKELGWYLSDPATFYGLADCNRFAWMHLGRMQEYLTLVERFKNPILGRPYGTWDSENHSWEYAVVDDKLIFINYGIETWPKKYDGRGSSAV